MKTQKQKFVAFLENQGFEVNHGISPKSSGFFYATYDITPHYRITPLKNHNIIHRIKIVNFDGSDTKKGDLGCVTICYYGRQKEYRRRGTQSAEILKKVFCPKTAEEAIKTYTKWEQDSRTTVSQWKIVL